MDRPWRGGGGSGGGTPIGEVPSGTIDGANDTFTLSQTPISGTLILQKDGMTLKPSVGYTISDATITFQVGYIPQVDDEIYANYSYS